MNRALLPPAGVPTHQPWSQWPGLRSVTFTGVDEATDWATLVNLSEARPEIEWGVLYSTQHAGVDGRWRYPSLAWIQALAERWPTGTRRALHLCGQAAHAWIAGDADLRALGAQFNRIQLNVVASRTDSSALHRALAQQAHAAVITQHHDGNRPLTEALGGLANHALLFDGSGGRGQLPGTWPLPLPHRAVGYAGGLGPLTIAQQARRIQDLVQGQPHWLDMEQALRDSEDHLDLTRVQAVLAALDQGA